MAIPESWLGPTYMVGAMTAYTVNDAFMKTLSGDIPIFQAILIRGVLSCLALAVLVRLYGGMKYPTLRRDRWLVIVRTFAEVVTAYLYLTALFNMPLANVSAILQALPLAVTLASALFLGEKIGWRRMLAIAIGFCGVMLIVRPGLDGFNVYAIYVLLGVVFITIRDLAVRRMSNDVSSTTAGFTVAIGVTIFGAVGSVGTTWQPVGLGHMGALVGATLALVAAYIWSVASMRHGEVSAVAPFRYSSLLAALLLDFFFFGEWPDTLTMIGAAIVTATGLFTLWREGRVKA